MKREIADHPSRSYLQPWRERMGDEVFFSNLTVFRMPKATAQVWTMETNFTPMAPVELL